MKRFYLVIVLIALSTNLMAADKKKPERTCKEGYTRYSCEDVKKARRRSFCWKGEVDDKKREKVCKTKKKRKKNRKAVKATS